MNHDEKKIEEMIRPHCYFDAKQKHKVPDFVVKIMMKEYAEYIIQKEREESERIVGEIDKICEEVIQEERSQGETYEIHRITNKIINTLKRGKE